MKPPVVFPKRGARNVYTYEQNIHRKRFRDRMARRAYIHGKNWRQVWIDCAGMCVHRGPDGFPCCSTEYLEFHEPFGEDSGWLRMQSRVLFCFPCHQQEHPDEARNRNTGNTLNDDVQIEIWMYGGWDKWIEYFNLKDTFGRLLNG